MYKFFPNYPIRALYPPVLGIPGGESGEGIRVSSSTAFYVDNAHPRSTDDNRGWDANYPLKTIDAAISKAKEGDWIVISGAYDGFVVDKSLTIIGDDAFVEAAEVEADNVIISNLSIESLSLEGDGFIIENCYFTGNDTGDGITAKGGDIFIKNCFFDKYANNINADVVTNFVMVDCIHSGGSTVFVKADKAGSTGLITKCSFATGTNSNSVFKIATGVKWAANYTEAGVSNARPA